MGNSRKTSPSAKATCTSLGAIGVLNDGAALNPAEFEAFLDAQADLPAVGRPRHVRVATDLPSTATNKVLKRELVRQGLDFPDPHWEREERGTAYHVVDGDAVGGVR